MEMGWTLKSRPFSSRFRRLTCKNHQTNSIIRWLVLPDKFCLIYLLQITLRAFCAWVKVLSKDVFTARSLWHSPFKLVVNIIVGREIHFQTFSWRSLLPCGCGLKGPVNDSLSANNMAITRKAITSTCTFIVLKQREPRTVSTRLALCVLAKSLWVQYGRAYLFPWWIN